MTHTNTDKVKTIVELSYVLDENLQQAKSLLDVALSTQYHRATITYTA